MKDIILASASPRRSELLKQIGIRFYTYPSDVDEVLDTRLTPEELVKKLSYQKALDVAEKMESQGRTSCLVIGADTIVVGEKLLGKPEDRNQAYNMLMSLSGRWHEVLTGISVIEVGEGKWKSSFERTRVKMKDLDESEIKNYIETGEPFDKAGAYGIQGIGAVLIERIEGCYFNVVGLPISKLTTMLKAFEVKVL